MTYLVIDNRIAQDGELIFDKEIKKNNGVSSVAKFILAEVPDIIGKELGKPYEVRGNNTTALVYGMDAFYKSPMPKRSGIYAPNVDSNEVDREDLTYTDEKGVTFSFKEIANDKFPCLENHMEVTLRNGYKMVVFNDSLLGHTTEKTHCMISLESYLKNGLHIKSKPHDIMQVSFDGAIIYEYRDMQMWATPQNALKTEIKKYCRYKEELDNCELNIARILELTKIANELGILITLSDIE